MPGSKNTEYRSLSNWLATGTCCVAIALRSAWIADWLIVSLKTQTLGPKVVVSASGHRLVAAAAGRGRRRAGGRRCAGGHRRQRADGQRGRGEDQGREKQGPWQLDAWAHLTVLTWVKAQQKCNGRAFPWH